MTGKVPEPIVMSGKSGRSWSERVILLELDECQSSRHSVDLGNLPGDSNNEDRLRVCKEMIRRNYCVLPEYHKCVLPSLT